MLLHKGKWDGRRLSGWERDLGITTQPAKTIKKKKKNDRWGGSSSTAKDSALFRLLSCLVKNA